MRIFVGRFRCVYEAAGAGTGWKFNHADGDISFLPWACAVGPNLGALCWRGSARIAVWVQAFSVWSFGRFQVGRVRFPVLRGGGIWSVDAEAVCYIHLGAHESPEQRCCCVLTV